MSARQQDQSQIKWISDFIWNIADDRLRDVYVRGKYRDVILPFTVLRRLDAVLEVSKDAVLERKKFLDTHKVAEQDGALHMSDHTELFKQFSDNPNFKRWLTDMVFDSTYHPGAKPPAPPQSGAIARLAKA